MSMRFTFSVPLFLSCWILLCDYSGTCPAFSDETERADPARHRVFATSRFNIDEILSRPYDPDVPMGCVGRRIWASSPQGWAFRDDVHWLYLTRLNAIELEVRDADGLLNPEKATYFPSHIQLEGGKRASTASASFTYTIDNPQNPLTPPFRPEKRWTCWSSGKREDWYAVDFGAVRILKGLRVYFFDDAPVGGCRPPDSFTVELWTGGSDGRWETVKTPKHTPSAPDKGANLVEFGTVATRKLRLVFRNAGTDYYTGLYGIEPISANNDRPQGAPPVNLRLTGHKFIAHDDVLVAMLHVENPSGAPKTVQIRAHAPLVPEGAASTHRWHDHDIFVRWAYRASPKQHAVITDSGMQSIEFQLEGGSSAEFRAVLAFDETSAGADRALHRWFDSEKPLEMQRHEYQKWFDNNAAYFECSDPWITRMYYHRAYVLRKNLLEPNLGRMPWKAFAEGRWRSGWYPNVISYGGGHQIREARWLRDKSHWQGHLRTFADNEKADGVYPSHVKPSGPQTGQYTDWITATAWDGHLVHPDKEFLGQVADKLADNVRGWQKVYDPDGDGLLFVDSHWWTGMEWQPSFFAFCDYKTDPKDRMHPLSRDKLDRVDLTVYNFGNAVAVARIYRLLGKDDKAREFDTLAEKIRSAVLNKLWVQQEKFFYSIRSGGQQKANVKEVIGVYPFYFDLPPTDHGYEQAWASIVDPEQFWTPWPVASASKQCPAYSQDGWPTDRGGSGCMWNGPTWPHANSIVLSAMANTLRQYSTTPHARTLPLSRDHFWELFHSFTKAQFRDQDIRNPWTGEFYNGETGKWKTAERDYNHSTWIDVLITGIVGLVPRNDETLEIDPLVPGKLSRFLLDGQSYHGHDITVVWDDPVSDKDFYGDGRRGLDVYVDGKRLASSAKLERVVVDMRQ